MKGPDPENRFRPVDDVTASITEKLRELDRTDEEHAVNSDSKKTRFLGFKLTSRPDSDESRTDDDLAAEQQLEPGALARVTIVEGPGRGHAFSITGSFTRIGRDSDQEIQLAFGDSHVSRADHATIVHYGKNIGFVIRDGLRVNPVLLNDRAVRGDTVLRDGDLIRIGATTLKFEAF